MVTEEIKSLLIDEGAQKVSVTDAVHIKDFEDIIGKRFKQGYLAGMNWLERSSGLRSDPFLHIKNAQSVITSAWLYPQKKSNKFFARYSLAQDYHNFIEKRMKRAWARFNKKDFTTRFFVDSKPIAEKLYAELSGLGWIGKNSILIDREIGSFFCIGLIITDLKLTSDERMKRLCDDCNSCIKHCPTGAIISPGVVDCRKCISYLTTEYKGSIPAKLRPLMGDNIFGCDICQEVCPNNKDNLTIKSIIPEVKLDVKDVNDLFMISKEKFVHIFQNTPVMRISYNRFRRNAAIVMGNIGNAMTIKILMPHLQDTDILLREHVTWAISEIKKREG